MPNTLFKSNNDRVLSAIHDYPTIGGHKTWWMARARMQGVAEEDISVYLDAVEEGRQIDAHEYMTQLLEAGEKGWTMIKPSPLPELPTGSTIADEIEAAVKYMPEHLYMPWIQDSMIMLGIRPFEYPEGFEGFKGFEGVRDHDIVIRACTNEGIATVLTRGLSYSREELFRESIREIFEKIAGYGDQFLKDSQSRHA